MADPAAQFPFVSSSSSSGQPQPGGCGGAGSASCADPPASSSSSQPVSLFAASPAGTEAAPGGRGGQGAFLPPAASSAAAASSSSSGGPPQKEPDSPESPFEVVPDRAAFDREFGPAAALLGEREVLSQIPEDRVCDFPAKPRGAPGVTPKVPTALCRQPSGTAAALEEVSKCVREMHTFTSELLNWDLVERNGGNGIAGDIGGSANAEADSSGDSDDTVIEEAPVEEPPLEEPPIAVPRHRVTAGVTGITAPPPLPETRPPPAAAATTRDWEEERLTLRALRELGEPPRDTPKPPGDPARPPPGTQLLPRLAVHDLLFWRDVKKTGLVFGASLLLLLSLAAFSAVSVVAHLALALLSVTISLRVYKAVVQAVQKSEEGHPFRAYLELDLTLSPETFQAHATTVALHLNRALRFLLRLFLVEDLVDSLKLAVVMWLLTSVGAIFNGITLLILAELLAFTLPPLYEKYKVQIDHYVGIARRQTKDLVAKIQAKLPGLAKKKPE
ncbi:reticulon-3 isoform X1 [Chroicocephalus ridibundus]|uniref:reticulon-3 isoform X1 n=1 Tax=Chroicocephalus ridibundus TaxID=1192867 RepID=UPI002FDECC1C